MMEINKINARMRCSICNRLSDNIYIINFDNRSSNISMVLCEECKKTLSEKLEKEIAKK